jgi:anthranilate phosphoribosyltransferase
MTIADVVARVVAREDLDGASMERAISAILRGEIDPVEIAALSVALRMKGETTAEIAGAVRAMRRACASVMIEGDDPIVDTCGTGGVGRSTFNVSTVVSLVVAASGYRVAKHGNRGMSSPTGSADVLEALGGKLELDPKSAARVLADCRFVFLYAPAFHGAMRFAGPVRKKLGVRTFWNLLGPLANPATASHQLMGVFDPARVEQLAEVLRDTGTTAAWVVHGEGGYDEIAPRGVTRVAALRDGIIMRRDVTPRSFGLDDIDPDSLRGGDAATNAGITRAILSGEKGGPREMVVLNAAAALHVAGFSEDLAACVARARQAIDSGDARRTLEAYVVASQRG